MSDSTPRFSLYKSLEFAKTLFGIEATGSPLPSERDQNFMLTTPRNERYILKIANSDEPREVLDLQNSALRHLQMNRPHIPVPAVKSALNGSDIAAIADRTGRSFFVRLLTWLEGDLLVHSVPHQPELIASLGEALAHVDCGLQSFVHSATVRQLHWDIRHAELALQHLPLIPPRRRAILCRFADIWGRIDWRTLRQGIIHGDANDYNVLVKDNRVVGFLDFGDMVHSAIACDLAIALAYIMLDKAQPLEAAARTAQAYHKVFRLLPAEVDALYPLVTARLCMSVCYAAYNAQTKSDDAYQQVTSAPAWALLEQLDGLPQAQAISTFRESCS